MPFANSGSCKHCLDCNSLHTAADNPPLNEAKKAEVVANRATQQHMDAAKASCSDKLPVGSVANSEEVVSSAVAMRGISLYWRFLPAHHDVSHTCADEADPSNATAAPGEAAMLGIIASRSVHSGRKVFSIPRCVPSTHAGSDACRCSAILSVTRMASHAVTLQNARLSDDRPTEGCFW